MPQVPARVETTTKAPAPPRNLVVSWRATAWTAISVAIVATASLAVVASINDTDALSTVALALAILAFVVQILVFLGQTQAQTQQSIRSEQLYANTVELLADIRASSEASQEALREQKDVLLPALLNKADLQRGPADQPLETPAGADAGASDIRGLYPPRTVRPDDPQVAELLQTWPTEPDEAREISERLKSLTPVSLYWIQALAEDELSSRTAQGPSLDPGLYLGAENIAELEGAGLIKRFDPPIRHPKYPDAFLVHLTDLGRRTARVLTARGTKPEELEGIDFPQPPSDLD